MEKIIDRWPEGLLVLGVIFLMIALILCFKWQVLRMIDQLSGRSAGRQIRHRRKRLYLMLIVIGAMSLMLSDQAEGSSQNKGGSAKSAETAYEGVEKSEGEIEDDEKLTGGEIELTAIDLPLKGIYNTDPEIGIRVSLPETGIRRISYEICCLEEVTERGVLMEAEEESSGAGEGGSQGSGQEGNEDGSPEERVEGSEEADEDGDPEADAGGDPEADAGGDPEADAGEDPEADAGEDPEADAGEDPEADAGEDPEADAGGDPEADEGESPEAGEGEDEPSGQDILPSEWEGSLRVDAKANNAEKVRVKVTVLCGDGEEIAKSLTISICTKRPIMEIRMDGMPVKVLEEGKTQIGYYNKARRASIVITDPAYAFDREAAEQGIYLNIDGKKIEDDISAYLSEWTHEGERHQVYLTFPDNVRVAWNAYYESRSELSPEETMVSGETPYDFVSDSGKPWGEISLSGETYSSEETDKTELILKDKTKVRARAGDDLSPVDISYFISAGGRRLSAEELEEEEFLTYQPFALKAEGRYRIYLRIRDAAGNETYVESASLLLDRSAPKIRLGTIGGDKRPKGTSKAELWNQDVSLQIKVRDPDDEKDSAGIRNITLKVTRGGETLHKKNLYRDAGEKTCNWEQEEVLKIADLGSGLIQVKVSAEDLAGNVSSQKIKLDIDGIAPKISLDFGDDQPRHGKYFSKPRTCLVTIEESAEHFDEKAAARGIKIQAVDGKGKNLKIDPASMISDWTRLPGGSREESKFVASIIFPEDAAYSFDVSYADLAGNQGEILDVSGAAPWDFVVDRTPPEGSLKVHLGERESFFSSLQRSLGFGLASSGRIEVTGQGKDLTSPLESLEMMKIDGKRAMTADELAACREWVVADSLTLEPEERCAAYLKVTDYAGNISYIGSDGLISDSSAPELGPDISIRDGQGSLKDGQGFVAGGDLDLFLTVIDPARGGVCSGLSRVSWTVKSEGKVTQQGLLFEDTVSDPSYDQLKKTWTGLVKVEAAKNQSDQVLVIVNAEDRAGNKSEEMIHFSVDTRKPRVSVRFENENEPREHYYSGSRTAKLTVWERNFDPDLTFLQTRPESGEWRPWGEDGRIEWTEWKYAGGSGDEKRYEASLRFVSDGDYAFNLRVSDKAGNQAEKISYEGDCENLEHFILDSKRPCITLSYDNNQGRKVGDTYYFSSGRTAKLLIQETNFREDLLHIKAIRSLDGKEEILIPAGFIREGDAYSCELPMLQDGSMVLEISAEDPAGNTNKGISCGDSLAPFTFVVDKSFERGQISGIADGQILGEVMPEIRLEDRNLGDVKVTLKRSRMIEMDSSVVSEQEVDVTADYVKIREDKDAGDGGLKSKKYLIDIPQRDPDGRSCDGLYCLTLEASDLAGNRFVTPGSGIRFSVNRFGAFFVLGKTLADLSADGGAYVKAVTEPLILTEYDPDSLKEVICQVRRDGEVIEERKETADSAETAENKDSAENAENKDSAETAEAVEDTKTEKRDDQAASMQWNTRLFRFEAETFSHDGLYQISVISQDRAGNRTESLSADGGAIRFRVDGCPPKIQFIRGLEKKRVHASGLLLSFGVFDSLGLKEVCLLDGDHLLKSFELHGRPGNFEGEFELPEGHYRELHLRAEDMAGNQVDSSEKLSDGSYRYRQQGDLNREVTISAAWWMALLTDQRIHAGGLAVSAVIVFVLIGLSLKKRRRGENKQKIN